VQRHWTGRTGREGLKQALEQQQQAQAAFADAKRWCQAVAAATAGSVNAAAAAAAPGPAAAVAATAANDASALAADAASDLRCSSRAASVSGAYGAARRQQRITPAACLGASPAADVAAAIVSASELAVATVVGRIQQEGAQQQQQQQDQQEDQPTSPLVAAVAAAAAAAQATVDAQAANVERLLKCKLHHKRVFTDAEEAALEQSALQFARSGIALTKQQFLSLWLLDCSRHLLPAGCVQPYNSGTESISSSTCLACILLHKTAGMHVLHVHQTTFCGHMLSFLQAPACRRAWVWAIPCSALSTMPDDVNSSRYLSIIIFELFIALFWPLDSAFHCRPSPITLL
jgi:hypothetical protein